jgi:DNA-directed RNA polymerase subunit M/transcription elongation factor TFIIS
MLQVGGINMVMWRAKSCPKCGGDIFLDIDEDTWFDHCLQCGYRKQRLKEVCPKCGFVMFLDSDVGNKIYHCSHCGENFELHKANK